MKYFIEKVNSNNFISVNMIVNVGTDHETKNELEYAHIIEHLFAFFTSSTFPNYNDVHALFKQYGIDFSAETHDYITKYIFITPKKNLFKLLDILFVTINDFKIDSSIFKKETNSVVIELKNIMESPEYLLDKKISELYFPNHSRSIPIKDRIRSTNNCSINSIMKFFNKYYNSNNIYFMFCGDISESYNKLLKKYMNPYNTNMYKPKMNSIKKLSINSNIYRVPKKDDKSYIKIYFKLQFDVFHENNYLLQCLLDILTEDLDSLLYKKLRSEKGLIYSISTDNNIDEYSSMSFISFDTDTNDTKTNILKIISIIINCILNLENEDIDKYVKNFIYNNKLEILKDKNCKDGEKMLEFYDTYFVFNKKKIDYYKYLEKFNQIKINKLIDFTKKNFTLDNLIIIYSSQYNINKDINQILSSL